MTPRASFVIIVLLGYYCTLSFSMGVSPIRKRETVCNTDVCKEAAQTLLDSIDKNETPCQDFYAYACGNYIKNHPLPDDKAYSGSFQALDEQAKEMIKEILETQNPKDIPEIKNAKDMYSHCMKKEDNVEVLKEKLQEFGGWPILSTVTSPSNSETSLESLLAQTTRRGLNAIVAMDVNVDMKNANENILMVDQGKLPLGRENILDKSKYKDLVEAYRKFITTSVSVLGSKQDHSNDIQLIIDFETKLANLTSKPENRRNFTELYSKLTIGELQQLTDPSGKIFDWNVYLNEVMQMDLNSSEPIVVMELEYLKNALQLIQETDQNIVINYIIWYFVKLYSWHTGGEMLDANFKFRTAKDGLKKEEARWLSCSQTVEGAFGFAIGRSYVDKHFSSESKQQAEEMIEKIHEAFSKRLENVSFLDGPTKGVAEDKSAAMRRLIGYPDWIHNDTAEHEYYIDYPVMNSAHLSNMIGAVMGSAVRQLKLLRVPVDKNRFYMTPATVNAMYDPTENSISFPAAILQAPFYTSGRPQFLNYGAIGSVVGHEITHGFDDQGSQFDKNGNLAKWWPEKVREAFVNDTQCFINQYDKYCPPELENTTKLCLNGKSTQGENIADNGGVAESFLAYKTWLDAKGQEEKLPGLEEYTSEQLFFLAFAHVWCSSATPQYLANQILYDPHSVARYRVVGTLSNSKDFAETFSCSKGSMNRGSDSCVLW